MRFTCLFNVQAAWATQTHCSGTSALPDAALKGCYALLPMHSTSDMLLSDAQGHNVSAERSLRGNKLRATLQR